MAGRARRGCAALPAGEEGRSPLNRIAEADVQCPYCGETISVLIDCSVAEQHYIEDCQVCCRPIGFHVTCDGRGDPEIRVTDENAC